ncbi:hypothetical protein [Chamaesiphon sp. VAR_48_metabat_403]|uniref:hypothetical protein n=1 Tax=Chamaesiphon sp. VAR_48_metabat_403 TaxID=2964700 RepID=UPI00286D8656|nr:hypothetical protein [Chamaesiphon sp. VAR_48_metabat_403]
MGRRLTAAQQRRAADLAQAREDYYRTRVIPPLSTVRRQEKISAVYSSILIKNGAASQLFTVQASQSAITKFGGLSTLGLRGPATVTDPVAPKPRGLRPAQVQAMEATSTPTASRSNWGTRVIKYSVPTAGNAQAHFVAPISVTTGVATFDLIDSRATAIYNAIIGTLGDLQYARFYLKPESVILSKN